MNRQQGFSLLEVMVAVFVLAIGLLGLAGLQLTSMQNTHSAFLRSQATLAAYSIVDDARANIANKSDYVISMGGTSSVGGLAQTDVNDWQVGPGGAGDGEGLDDTLPGGQGSVVVNGDRMTVTVQWADRGTQGTTQNFTVVTDI